MTDFNGYKVIDLEGNNITNSGSFTVDGLYERLESNSGVAILIGNFSYDGRVQCAQFVNCISQSNGSYDLTLMDGKNSILMVVDDEDTVTCSVTTLATQGV